MSRSFPIGPPFDSFTILLSSPASSFEHAIGTNVMATTREAARAKHTTSERSWNNCPIDPLTNIRGMKTATVVRVEAATDMPTSFVPLSAASIAGTPSE